MCGRFSLGLTQDEIQQMHGYNVHVAEWVDHERFQPRHNIAPRSEAPVIRRRHAAAVAGSTGTHISEDTILHTMKWGLVPHWSKHEDNTLRTINARSENLVKGGGMWGSIKGRKRCAVPCEGYYEWLKKGKEKLPHFTKRQDGKLMLLAGLYDCVTLEGQTKPLWTFTIVTTDANEESRWLHDRQPVILSTDMSLQVWLDTTSKIWTSELSKLVEPYSDVNSPLTCYQVSKEVGKVGVESATFIQPVSQREDGIQAMFAKQQGKGSPSKRKRSLSPKSVEISPRPSPSKIRKYKEHISPPSGSTNVIDFCEGGDEPRKPKVEKLNTWEDDSETEYVDGSSQSDSEIPNHESRKGKAKLGHMKISTKDGRSSMPTTPKKNARAAKADLGSAKITSFFGKA